jgi:hypothetical protein
VSKKEEKRKIVPFTEEQNAIISIYFLERPDCSDDRAGLINQEVKCEYATVKLLHYYFMIKIVV